MRAIAKLVLAELIVATFGVGLAIYFSDAVLGADEYSRFSLVASILAAFMLGVLFWYIQKQDNENTKKLLALQNKIAEEIHRHVVQQQQIQDSIRSSSFRYIKANLRSALQQIDRMEHQVKNYEGKEGIERSFYLNDQLQRTAVFKSYPNAIEQQLTIARPYIHADLALKIESIAGAMRYLWLSSADHSESRVFVAGIPDSVDAWLRYSHSMVAKIEEVISEIQKAEDSSSLAAAK